VAGTQFTPGTVLAGRFVLDDLLDENHGASFWRATDRTLARSVAVHLLDDTDRRAEPLLTAARSSALVGDGRLLRVLDAADADGVVYVVNEWGSGVSLDRLVADGPLSPRRAAWVVREVAEAISTAHRHEVSHGRLLPQNVMISEAGSVKLVGFAVDAVLHSADHDGADHEGADHEGADREGADGEGGQDRGAEDAQASDVRNLGALLYAALVGRWPGTSGSTLPAAPTEHGRPLRPRRVRAGVPRPLDAICERLLNPQSHANVTPLESAHEVWAALSDYIGDPGAATVAAAAADHVGHGEEDTAGDSTGDGTDDSTGDSPGDQIDTDDTNDNDTNDLPSTDAMPALDPEATQAASPMLLGVPPDPRPERPLFADGPPAAARTTSSTRGSSSNLFVDPVTGEWQHTGQTTGPTTGPTTGLTSGPATGPAGGPPSGTVPPLWGPDADEPPPAEPDWTDHGQDSVPGRSWLRLAVGLAVLLLVAVAVVFAFNLGRGSENDQAGTTPSASPSPSASASREIAISSVSDFDPEGDPPDENPDETSLAVDGNPDTAWQTLTYKGNPKLGGLKTGVGLLVDLGKPAKVGEVRLTLIGSPTSLQILAAPEATTEPTSTDGLTEVASASAAGTDVDLKLDKPTTTRWLVVWLTSLPQAPGGFKGQVAEVAVRS
jgi:protein kinase-like protein